MSFAANSAGPACRWASSNRGLGDAEILKRGPVGVEDVAIDLGGEDLEVGGDAFSRRLATRMSRGRGAGPGQAPPRRLSRRLISGRVVARTGQTLPRSAAGCRSTTRNR